uniref:Cation efflux protein transmembrane domain-containing protein n=1 Tax=Gossypium raimondii TaxID=29730 RepID=A0A0D2PPW9_GOSRA|nr:hypothetical protein B456_001G112900 [Gossypium raimondii]
MEDGEVSIQRLKEIEMPMVSDGNTVISMTPELKCCSGCVFSGRPNTALESKERHKILHENDEVNGALMFAVAAFRFVINLVMVLWLGHDHTHHACRGTVHHRHHDDHHSDLATEEETSLVPSGPKTNKIMNINLQGAYLHVVADLIQTVGVMITGAVIWIKPKWLIVDLLCTLIFSTVALSTTLPMLRDIFSILMERTAGEINIDMLESGIKGIDGVQNIHDLHVWAITVGY